MDEIEAPAPASICSNAGPAARVTCPFMSSGHRMRILLGAKPPASQASASTMAPASLMIFLMSAMNGDALSRFACSWFFTSPGISVALNCGWRPAGVVERQRRHVSWPLVMAPLFLGLERRLAGVDLNLEVDVGLLSSRAMIWTIRRASPIPPGLVRSLEHGFGLRRTAEYHAGEHERGEAFYD